MHLKFWKIGCMMIKIAHVDGSFWNWCFISLQVIYIINDLSSCGNFWSQWCGSELGNFWLTVAESEKIYQSHSLTAPLYVMFVDNKSILCFMYSHIPIYKLQDWKFGLITLFNKADIKNWKQCRKNSCCVLSIYWCCYEGFIFWGSLSSVIYCRVVGWMSTDGSEEPLASSFFGDGMNLGTYLPQHHTQEDHWICFTLQFLTVASYTNV